MLLLRNYTCNQYKYKVVVIEFSKQKYRKYLFVTPWDVFLINIIKDTIVGSNAIDINICNSKAIKAKIQFALVFT